MRKFLRLALVAAHTVLQAEVFGVIMTENDSS